jgi:predicted phage replisome organizer
VADIKWIKIVTDIFDDEKILLIETLPEADSIIVIWFKLLCLAGKQNNSGVFMMNDRVPYNDKMFATIFRRKESTVQLALKTFEEFGMIEIIEGAVTIPNWGKHQNIEAIETRREYKRLKQAEYRERQKLLTGGHTRGHTRVQNVDTQIREDKNNIYVDFFEQIWQLYPKKEGKGQVSLTQKKKLYSIGLEEMTRAIERYVKAKQGKDKQYLQNGSTFFNSGYVDYLDANYQEDKPESLYQEI